MLKSPTANAETAHPLPRRRWWLSVLPRLSARSKRGIVVACLAAAMLAPAIGRLHSATSPAAAANPAVQNALHQLGLSAPNGPIGNQFQVNSYTTAAQTYPAVAIDDDGDFVVIWSSVGSSGSDNDGQSIQGQRYNAAGVAQGSQFQVNSYTTSNQRKPAVAMDSDGDFVVVWESRGSSGNDTQFYSVQGQRYNAAGVAQGSNFQANSYSSGSQSLPAVAMDSSGDFAIVWMSYGSYGNDSNSTSIQGQRYNAAGTPQGSQFQVNTFTPNFQRFPAVAMDSDGDFVIVWDSDDDDGSGSYTIQGQRYNAAGAPQGSQFQANNFSTFSQYNPTVAMDDDGNFVVIWDNAGQIGIEGQRYNAAGAAQGDDFPVHSDTINGPRHAAVAMDSDGDFVVVWERIGDGGSPDDHAILAQGYNTAGVPQGSLFQVNSYATGAQRLPAVAMESNGEFVVVWDSAGSTGPDSSEYSIQGQRFSQVVVTLTEFLYLPAVVSD
jgi:hypothetical protein